MMKIGNKKIERCEEASSNKAFLEYPICVAIIDKNQEKYIQKDPLIKSLMSKGVHLEKLIIDIPDNLPDILEEAGELVKKYKYPILITYLDLFEENIKKTSPGLMEKNPSLKRIAHHLTGDTKLYCFDVIKQIVARFRKDKKCSIELSIRNIKLSGSATSFIFARMQRLGADLMYSWSASPEFYERNAKYLIDKN